MSKRASRRPVRIKSSDTVTVNALERTELWLAASFAPSWFRDALNEAQRAKGDVDARRREILFAVCFLESYLLEWTRYLLGPRDFKKYFPPGRKGGIRDKWKRVIKELAKDKKIPGKPGFGGADWTAFIQLVDYRDGLVHAKASLPTSKADPSATPPIPSPDDLRDMEPGWPVRVVADLVRSLHAAVDSATPRWLVNP
jgi:hypothetical protein